MKYKIDNIIDSFNNLSIDKRYSILCGALDYMQQYNGRSKYQCIALAMGYHNPSGENDTWELLNAN